MSEFMDPNEAKVYVATYGKYNAGSLKGKWVKLSDFDNHDEFIDYCSELHSDEDEDALELMFQDCENLPSRFYSESDISPEFWDYLEAFNECDDQEAFEVFTNLFDDWSLENFHDRYVGHYDSNEDFARQLVDDGGFLSGVPDFVAMYFDYSAFARDLMLNGEYVEDDGYYFFNF